MQLEDFEVEENFQDNNFCPKKQNTLKVPSLSKKEDNEKSFANSDFSKYHKFAENPLSTFANWQEHVEVEMENLVEATTETSNDIEKNGLGCSVTIKPSADFETDPMFPSELLAKDHYAETENRRQQVDLSVETNYLKEKPLFMSDGNIGKNGIDVEMTSRKNVNCQREDSFLLLRVPKNLMENHMQQNDISSTDSLVAGTDTLLSTAGKANVVSKIENTAFSTEDIFNGELERSRNEDMDQEFQNNAGQPSSGSTNTLENPSKSTFFRKCIVVKESSESNDFSSNWLNESEMPTQCLCAKTQQFKEFDDQMNKECGSSVDPVEYHEICEVFLQNGTADSALVEDIQLTKEASQDPKSLHVSSEKELFFDSDQISASVCDDPGHVELAEPNVMHFYLTPLVKLVDMKPGCNIPFNNVKEINVEKETGIKDRENLCNFERNQAVDVRSTQIHFLTNGSGNNDGLRDAFAFSSTKPAQISVEVVDEAKPNYLDVPLSDE